MKDLLTTLVRGRILSYEEMCALLGFFLDSEACSDYQRSSILTSLSARHLTVDEVQGVYDTLWNKRTAINSFSYSTLDICGTGGDGKDTFNISTASALVVAAAGIPVTKFGNRSASSLHGSSDLVSALGIAMPEAEETVHQDVSKKSITFLHAPHFYRDFAQYSQMRRDLGFATFFNVAGPLLNPISPSHRVIGVASSYYIHIYGEILSRMKSSFAIVHSFDGYDEISLTGRFVIQTDRKREELSPHDIGVQVACSESLRGGTTAQENCAILEKILDGTGYHDLMHVVAINAGVGISLFRRTYDWKEGYNEALSIIACGKALQKLRELTSKHE